jgi:creatinine amidohydrolase/Fe(II)-dependent formamide hydrolase-like protein
MSRGEVFRALEDLLVIDRLDVGPARVEPHRVSVPYRVTSRDGTETIDLVFRYDEPVLDPASEADRALAAMLGAQVALNYGLFCRQIAFHGCHDDEDLRYLQRFAAHTAREIYVHKILLPNRFLVEGARALTAERRESYLQAEILRVPDHGARRSWRFGTVPDPNRHAVLSSGGKESLLSFGLLDELGAEVHPVFVNESGRHWFTAMGAYRRFRREVPHTARVWTNCDRVFGFMLRQLPFVRPDFARVRSDAYPIRLWTVAVLVFAALPLMLRRGIGRLVLGCEHDTTLRGRHEGISHRGGLYDQSRPFDAAVSRYFKAKGVPIAQFSLLRPLSELLVEKVLVERYPELQRLQISCHAASVEGERVRPCGRCEKCRRVVGMLVALGADPETCGYVPEDIEGVLVRAVRSDLHQEPAVIEHTLHMLAERGRLAAPAEIRPHPEVLRLRFDADRSPWDAIPNDLREPLYRIMLEHAEGAVERRGRQWVEADPLAPGALTAPYPFDLRSRPRSDGAKAATGGGPAADEGLSLRFRLAEMTWPEARARLEQTDIALIPVGAIEQHGPHLPLDTDAFDAAALCEEVSSRCTAPRPLVLPAIAYGVSYHHDDFPGTLSVGPDTLARYVYDVGMSAARHGVVKLVIVNGHGGNGPALHFAAQMINRDARVFTCVDTGETSDQDVEALAQTPNDVHAGEVETSTSLWLRPELVRSERAKPFVPRFSSAYLDFTSQRAVGWYARTRRISSSGVLGDPTKASREKGRQMWELMVRHLVSLVEHLKGLTLDEIHQTRY